MKRLIIILLALSFVSCNPFLSKEHRRKKKCNRKLERVTDKCPELLTNETVTVIITDTIPEVQIDSFIVLERDTAEIDSLVSLIKNKKTREIIREYITKYVPIKDTTIHLADGYTIKFYSLEGNIHYSVEKPLEVVKTPHEIVVETVKPVELTPTERFLEVIYRFWWVILLIILTAIGLKYLHRRLFPKE